jgi:uncharacterized membrane protein
MTRKNLFLKRWLLQGIVVILPLLVTVFCLYNLIVYTDAALWFVCTYLPFELPKPIFPGIGLLVATAALILIGALTESYLITQGIALFNYTMSKLPVIRTIYTTVHKIVESTIGHNSSFSKAVLIEYPRQGMYSIAFKTSDSTLTCHKTGEKLVNIFLPTTPNPTSGFYLLLPENQIYDTDLNPEDAFKLIISAGMVQK